MPANNPKLERTYVMVKPDGVRRGLVGEIIRRIENTGLKLVALKLEHPSFDQMDNHYPKDEAWITRLGEKTLKTYAKAGWDPIEELGTDKPEEIGPQVRKWLIEFMTSGPVVKMAVEGVQAVETIRKLTGPTMPIDAAPGTIRGDFSNDTPLIANFEKRPVTNIIHASETPEEAEHELKHWFGDEGFVEYTRTDDLFAK